MKKSFGGLRKRIKMKHVNTDTWMCWYLGVDELKICDQGRFKPKSFSQETGRDGQHQPRIGFRPLKSVVQDARRILAHLPLSFFSLLKKLITKKAIGFRNV